MPQTRPAYEPELRRRIVGLARSGRSVSSLAQEFEPTETTIRHWIAQADRDDGRGDGGLTTDERKELNQLRRENRTLRKSVKSQEKPRRGSRRRPTRHRVDLRLYEG
jgi:transposase